MSGLGRRLDRSLDKSCVLNDPDRQLVGQLRNAVEKMHNKVENLRDGIDERFAQRYEWVVFSVLEAFYLVDGSSETEIWIESRGYVNQQKNSLVVW